MDDKRMAVLLDEADSLGWSVYEDESGWDIRKASPAGEDFGFFVHKSSVKDAGDFVREVRKYADDFDPDENIEMWVEARRSGTRSIPEIRTLVQDADDIQDMLDELADTLEGVRYSFDIGFVNPDTGKEDETEFDADDEQEARDLFEIDFCNDNGWEEVPEILYVKCIACEDDDAEAEDEELKPYSVTVRETLSRTVVIWAADRCDAEEKAAVLCTGGKIYLADKDFTGRECECNGEVQESGLSFYEQYGRKGDRK